MEKILVAVDDSQDSLKAFNYAISLAKKVNAKIAVATIFEINRLNVYQYLNPTIIKAEKNKTLGIANSYVEKAQQAGLEAAEAYVDEGNPAEIIMEQIVPLFQPDLLVCGSSDDKSFIRSQANEFAKHAECSVLIVK